MKSGRVGNSARSSGEEIGRKKGEILRFAQNDKREGFFASLRMTRGESARSSGEETAKEEGRDSSLRSE
jgi:hypothetical protein